MWRAPEGPEGTQGLAAVPVGGGGAWPGFEPTRRAIHQQPSATGVEGAGGTRGPGCGARGRWPGLAGLRADAPSEARRADGERAGRRPRAHRAARPSKAHKAARPSRHPGTPKGRVPQYPPPCRLTQPLPRRGSGRMILSPGDGDASTGTCRPRRPLPGPPRRSGRRSRCAQGAGSGRCSAWWPGRRARRTRSSRR